MRRPCISQGPTMHNRHDCTQPGAPFTLASVSKTERDLASDKVANALDEIFDAADFDEALDDALNEADDSVPLRRSDGADEDESEHVEADDEAAINDTPADHHGASVDDELDLASDGSNGHRMPQIVPASSQSDASRATADAFVEPSTGDEPLDDEAAEEILEELRRADIDGPQIEMAPQDITTAERRNPRRAVDYDPAPVPIAARVPRVLGRKPRVRKVTRVVRYVDPWSVFKVAIVANLVLYVTLLTSGVLLWNVAHATGTVDNVERFFESFGWQSFEFNGGELYHAAWTAGLFGVIALTGFAVLLATLFNLITDLVGGVRFTVLEEEVVETRTSPLRRFVVRRPEPEVPATVRDASGAMVREAVVDDTGANPGPSR